MKKSVIIFAMLTLQIAVFGQSYKMSMIWDKVIEPIPDSLYVDSIWYPAFKVVVYEATAKEVYDQWKARYSERCEGVRKKKGLYMADCVEFKGAGDGAKDVFARVKENTDGHMDFRVAILFMEKEEARREVKDLGIELNKGVVIRQINVVQKDHDGLTDDLEKAHKDLEKTRKDLEDHEKDLEKVKDDETDNERDLKKEKKELKALNDKYAKKGDARLLDKIQKAHKNISKFEKERKDLKREQNKLKSKVKKEERNIEDLEKEIEELGEERDATVKVLELLRTKYGSIQ